MKLRERITKKFLLTRILPIAVFVLITISVFGIYSTKLRHGTTELLQGKVSYAVQVYSSYMEEQLGRLEGQMALVADMMGQGAISSDQAMEMLSNQKYVVNVAIVSSLGVGEDINNNGVNLPAKGFSGVVKKENPTYFYGGEGLIYILEPVMENGSVTKAVMVVCDTAGFDDLFLDFAFGSDSFLILQDNNGQIVYSFQDNNVDYLQSDSNFIDALEASKGKASSVINSLKKQRSGCATVKFEDGNRHVAYHYIKESGWFMILGVPDSYFATELKSFRHTVLLMMLSLLGCMLLYMAIVIYNYMLSRMSGKRKSDGLLHLAETDQLTGLYNKVTTERKIKEYFEEHPDSQCLLFVLDIDNFKKINDTMGHAFGDEVLREIGQGLKQQFRASDIIGRAGGDEFIILLKHVTEDQYIIREAKKLENFFNDLQVGTYTKYSVTSSIGCAIFGRDGNTFETLYKQADEALYKAKHRGKNQLAFYKDPEGFGQNV